MRIKNDTNWVFANTVTSTRPPTPEMSAILVGTFDLVPNGISKFSDGDPQTDQDPICGERCRDDDEAALLDVVYPGDFAPFKPRGEMIYTGDCHTPDGKEMTECPIKMRVGKLSKTLKVIGRRVWEPHLIGKQSSEPHPFTTMPVDYRHAYGGPSFELNPAGIGHENEELPNIEWPDSITRPSDHPPPASFGPLNINWPQRKNKVGTNYGASWKKNRAPFYSDDFDWEHFLSASKDQWQEDFFRGGEELELVNLVPGVPNLITRLPDARPRVFISDDQQRRREIAMVLDTVYVVGDKSQVRLTYRGLTAAREIDLADIKFVMVKNETSDESSKTRAQYLEELAAWEADPVGIADLQQAFDDEDPDAVVAATLDMAAKRGIEVEPPAKIGAPKAGAPAETNPLSELLADKLGDRQKGEQDKIADALGKADAEAKKPVDRSGPSSPEISKSLDQADKEKAKVDLNAELGKAAEAQKESKPPAMPKAASPGKAPAIPLGKQVGELKEAVGKGKEDAAAALERAKEQGHDTTEAEEQLARLDELEERLNDPRLAEIDPSLAADAKEAPDELEPGMDLSGCDLSERDLSGQDLTECNFTGANLTRANLDDATLSKCNFTKATLLETRLARANADECCLDHANLSDATLPDASLKKATLNETILAGADLSGACLDRAEGESIIARGANLEGSSAHQVRFTRCLFGEVSMARANWSAAVLVNCRFEKASAELLNLEDAHIDLCGFVEADLSSANLKRVKGKETVWLDADLTDATLRLAVLPTAHFSGATLTRADMFGGDFRFSRFKRCTMDEVHAERANFFSADLCNAHLSNTHFDDANLYDAKFIGAAGHEASFVGANLNKTVFYHGEAP